MSCSSIWSELKAPYLDGWLVGANSIRVLSDVVAKHLRISVEVVKHDGGCGAKPRAHLDDEDAPCRSKIGVFEVCKFTER